MDANARIGSAMKDYKFIIQYGDKVKIKGYRIVSNGESFRIFWPDNVEPLFISEIMFTSEPFKAVEKWSNLSDYLVVFMTEPDNPYRYYRSKEGTQFAWGDNGYRMVESRGGRIYHTWHGSNDNIPAKYLTPQWKPVIEKNKTKTLQPKACRLIRPASLLGLIDMIQYIESVSDVPLDQFIGCEIGTYQGEAADIFARKFQWIWTVDPWTRKKHIGAVRDAYYENMAKHKNSTHLQMRGDEVVGGFYDSMFDFIYIDADHSYKAVVSDIEAWKPKLKPDGFLCGHDYMPGREGRKGEVASALIDAIGKPDRVFDDSSWVVQYKGGERI